jgi:arsenate reductase
MVSRGSGDDGGVKPPDVKPGGARGGRPRLGGHGTLPLKRDAGPPPAPLPAGAAKKRVLFVCIGNSCRSQMAEAFARVYGRDVMDPHSAGLAPATIIAPLTQQVLLERNVAIDGQFPKGLDMMARVPFDIVVNMSGTSVVLPGARLIEWPVADPMGQKDEVYRAVAARIEGLVMRLIIELRGTVAVPLSNPAR